MQDLLFLNSYQEEASRIFIKKTMNFDSKYPTIVMGLLFVFVHICIEQHRIETLTRPQIETQDPQKALSLKFIGSRCRSFASDDALFNHSNACDHVRCACLGCI